MRMRRYYEYAEAFVACIGQQVFSSLFSIISHPYTRYEGTSMLHKR